MHSIVFEIGAFILFFVLAYVLARDDGPYGRWIRIAEIMLPLAAAIAAYEASSQGADAAYFIAAACFVFAFLYALTRRLFGGSASSPGVLGEGASVFLYGVFILAGVFFAASAFFHFQIIPG